MRKLSYILTPLALLVAVSGCMIEEPTSEGRPCSDDAACGPGTRCDPDLKKCVASNGKTDGQRPPDSGQTDSYKPDTRKPDSLVAKDGGCPKGMSRCGKVCVDLNKDLRHCGKCNSACQGGRADRCFNGRCVCGKGSSACASTLNCIAGSCKCVKGGSCPGCCSGNTCVALGSAQSASKCGKGGDACKSCYDGLVCTSESCSATGSCLKTNKSSSTVCDDKNACTHTDRCAAGKCAGKGYSCKASQCQASSTCDGKGGCKVTLKSNGSSCSDSISCTYSDKCSAGVCKGTTYSCKVKNSCQASASCNGLGGCSYTNKGNGTSCSDGVSCTYNDKCTSGACKGTSYSCNDSRSCTTDTCLGSGPGSGCLNKLNSGNCLISGVCYVNGISAPGNACLKCDTSKSVTAWTPSGGGQGCVSTVAGTGSSSVMWNPSDVDVDAYGVIYVADRANNRILRISSGKVTVIAGTGVAGYKDGSAATAQFNRPQGIVVSSGGALYVADRNNHRIRLITGGNVTTVGGTGTAGYKDGAVSTSQFNDPHDVDADTTGKLYVADTGGQRIRRLWGGSWTTVAGSGSLGYADGSASTAKFYYPYGIALDSSGTIYVADGGNHRIRKISGGQVSTFAGTGTKGFANGSASQASFNYPQGVAVGFSGRVYVADRGNHLIRVIASGLVSTVAGSSAGFADGPVTSAKFYYPYGVAHRSGKVYVADYNNNRIRLVSP